MSRNLADLKEECKLHGLTVKQSGKREAKSDYEEALRTHYWTLHCQSVTGDQAVMPEQIEPMLARNIKDLELADAEKMWQDGNQWVAQNKINGARCVLHVRNPMAGRINHATSRRISDETYRLNELHDVVPHYRDLYLGDEWEDTIIDGELLMPTPVVDTRIVDRKGVETADILQATASVMNCDPAKSVLIQEKYGKLVLHAFDCLRFKGKDIRNLPYVQRYEYLAKVVARVTEVMGELPCSCGVCGGTWRSTNVTKVTSSPSSNITQDDFFNLLNEG